ncbi:MAG TPA: dienelactone hydrolase family protein [Candidatus Dormibacteraeota bacterium]|jgi:carboxymethylenebutenolidase|nr:dienelactone hydrolase family protein [Candidatus Dormibacteraeota bacterium]
MPNITTDKHTLAVADGSSMQAFVARPEEKGSFPGMLVFQEAFGVNAHIRDVTQRIAREGYVAIAPELFHRSAAPGLEVRYDDFPSAMPHMKALTEQGLSDDVRATYEWLRDSTHVVPDRIGSIGFCMGGRVSFLANATIELRAAISFYGGGIAPALLPHAANLHAPMVFFWGGLDKHIPQDQIRSVIDAVKAAGKPYINVEISDADHGFFCDARPSYNPVAAKEAWSLVVSFLEAHVKRSEERTQSAR